MSDDAAKLVEWRQRIAEERARESERNRARADRMSELVRKLKASRNPRGEDALVRSIRELGHPDVDGLLTALCSPTDRKPRGGL